MADLGRSSLVLVSLVTDVVLLEVTGVRATEGTEGLERGIGIVRGDDRKALGRRYREVRGLNPDVVKGREEGSVLGPREDGGFADNELAVLSEEEERVLLLSHFAAQAVKASAKADCVLGCSAGNGKLALLRNVLEEDKVFGGIG